MASRLAPYLLPTDLVEFVGCGDRLADRAGPTAKMARRMKQIISQSRREAYPPYRLGGRQLFRALPIG
jgi:hypothetical protein